MNSITASTEDSAEALSDSLASGTSTRIDGYAGPVAAAVGSYLDHDTYSILTGATTTQLSIRLDWSAAGADLDYYVMSSGDTFAFASSATASTTGPEFATFAVLPNWRYWVWIGSYSGNAAYEATLCADTYSAD